jgi:hypothetical protein
MSWARCLKRVFGIEIECCARCGGTLAIIASIEEPPVQSRLLRERHGASSQSAAEAAGFCGCVPGFRSGAGKGGFGGGGQGYQRPAGGWIGLNREPVTRIGRIGSVGTGGLNFRNAIHPLAVAAASGVLPSGASGDTLGRWSTASR